jgi:TetR/AcrR family transcriptional regulator, transcriptional repressor for nem operon
MKVAGLTHGAFYRYFPSKEALIAEAVGRALPPVPDRGKPQRSAVEYADHYLSVRRRDNRATSCLFSSPGTDAARGSAELRHSMTQGVRRRIGHLSAEAKGDTPHAKRRATIAAWSTMVGAMVLARIVDDEKLSKEILTGHMRRGRCATVNKIIIAHYHLTESWIRVSGGRAIASYVKNVRSPPIARRTGYLCRSRLFPAGCIGPTSEEFAQQVCQAALSRRRLSTLESRCRATSRASRLP